MRGLGLGSWGLDGLREEGTGNLLGDEGTRITSVEEGLGEVSGVGVGDCRIWRLTLRICFKMWRLG